MTKTNELMSETAKKELVITRTFNAPRELVYKVWSESSHLGNWWGPKGLSMKVVNLDFRPGGKFHYCMSTPEGFEMWGLFVYGDIMPPEKIEFVTSFADADGNPIRAPFSPVFPLEIHNTLTLEDENGQTKLTLRGWPKNASEEEIVFFESMQQSMNEGFKGTFDQLDEYLANIK